MWRNSTTFIGLANLVERIGLCSLFIRTKTGEPRVTRLLAASNCFAWPVPCSRAPPYGMMLLAPSTMTLWPEK